MWKAVSGKPDSSVFSRKGFFESPDKKFCKEGNIPYIDILTPMRAVSPIKSLYVSDGVHLSPAGGRVIADEILKFLAEKYR